MFRTQSSHSRPRRRAAGICVLSIFLSALSLVSVLAQTSVSTWGADDFGQLGDGRLIYTLTALPVAGLSGFKQVSAGFRHSLALKSDGTVYAWGDNTYGQLGIGTYDITTVPTKITALTNVVKVAAGGYFSLALKSDGTVWAFGANYFGDLGIGTNSFSEDTPMQVVGLTGVTDIAVGADHAAALTSAGKAYTWGANYDGQVGDGTTNTRILPFLVLTGVSKVGAGNYNTFAFQTNGTALSWGYNYDGEIGDGSVTQTPPYSKLIPTVIPGLTSVKTIGGGAYYGAALKTDGTVWTWATNYYGTLGDGTNSALTPHQVANLSGIKELILGTFTVFARKTDNTIVGWGRNDRGEFGIGTTDNSDTPVAIPEFNAALSLACGDEHVIAVKPDGTISVTGRNNYGQLGDGSAIRQTSPVPTAAAVDLSETSAVSAGQSHSIALKSDGTVWAWGSGGSGQIGDNNYLDRSVPTQAMIPDPITHIAAGGRHSLALNAAGTNIYAWGEGYQGQLGTGYNYATSYPGTVSGLTGTYTAIAGGDITSYALKSDGSVWAWGDDGYGQLGDDNSGNQQFLPVQVHHLSGAAAIAAGGNHALALKPDGTVYAWGSNGDGECGLSTFDNGEIDPVQIPGLTGITAIAAGFHHSLALASDGTVWAWGRGDSGQMGDGNFSTYSFPNQVPGLTNIVQIAAGEEASAAVDSSGTVWTWGQGSDGQLGLGDTYNYGTPQAVPSLANITQIAVGGRHTIALTGTALQLGPTDLQHGDIHSTTIDLNWLDNNTNETGFHVQQKVGSNYVTIQDFAPNDQTVSPRASVTVNVLSPETTYTLRVAAFIGTTDTAPSNEITFTTAPKPPTNFTAMVIGDTKVNLTWTDNTLIEENYALTRYRYDGVTYYTFDKYIFLPANTTSYHDTGLLSGQSYLYFLSSYRSDTGYSDAPYAFATTTGTPPGKVSGHIQFDGLSPTANSQYVTFTFRPADNSGDIVDNEYIAPDGTYSYPYLPRKKYNILFQCPLYLKTLAANVNVTGTPVTVDPFLPGGDATDVGGSANKIDFDDFLILLNAFGSDVNIANSGYDANADFTQDGKVNFDDFLVLLNNYGAVGDN